MNELNRMEYDALTRQLERMRAMQYAYNRKFFILLLVSVVGSAVLLLLGKPAGLILVCFGLVTAGMTASFFLHFCDFARVYARALEARINHLLGRPVLIASELEADYFYPHGSRKLSGFSFERPVGFFSVFTLHFSAVWAALVLWAGARLLEELPIRVGWQLFLGWAAWVAANVAYLNWWFAHSGAERREAAALEAAYGLDPGSLSGPGANRLDSHR